MTVSKTDQGLLIVGHGTRDAEGTDEFLESVALVAERLPRVHVRAAFLELQEPDVVSALSQMAAVGIRETTVAPLLLLAAGHAKQDIPQALQRAQAECRFARLAQAGHLGCHENLVALSSRRVQESLGGSQLAAHDSLLILVGRGNRDPMAWQEMRHFATLKQASLGEVPVRVAYLSMAPPALDDVLAEVSRSDVRNVVVQPHLLFRGQLLQALRDRVERERETSPRRWFVTDHLGPSPLLAEAVVARFLQAQQRQPFAESE